MRGPGLSEFADDPNKPTIFEHTHGARTIFQLLETNDEQKKSFDDYMREWRSPNMKQWFDNFPIKTKLANARDDPDAVLFVDVAGGLGHEGELFRQRNPDVAGKFVLQELKLTLDRMDRKPEGVETMVYDFFEPQPVKCRRTTTGSAHDLGKHLKMSQLTLYKNRRTYLFLSPRPT